MSGFKDHLFGYLTAQAGFAALIADGASPETWRLFPVQAGENPVLPCVIYRTVSAIRDFTFDGPTGTVSERVQFDVLATTQDGAQTVADALRSALNGYSGAMGSIDCHYAHLDSSQDLYDAQDRTSRVTLDFIITHTE